MILLPIESFRRNWQVNEFGKWSEPNYQAVAYPPFPCGSAYMLSADLIGWLSTNSESLFRFQGEDVSMGIWLAAILPTYEHVGDFFLTERSCLTNCISLIIRL